MTMTYYQEIKDDRDEWRQRFCHGRPCMVCTVCSNTGTLDCHEIIRKSAAPRQWGHRSNYLAVCRRCHDNVITCMSLSQQLAYKLLRDPDHFSLSDISRIAGREISLRDVVARLEFILL